MKINRILIKTILFISLVLFITEPINLTVNQRTHVPETTSVNLSAPYDWISLWSRFDNKSEEALDVAIDSNDDIIIGGQTINTTIDQFVAKFDETGTQLWNDTRDGGNQDRFKALAVSGTEIYVGSNYRNLSTSRSECFLGKYDGSGNYLWNRTWFKSGGIGCYTSDMTLCQTGDFFFIGEITYGSQFQYFILKLDSGGTEVWNVTFGLKDESRKSILGVATFNDLIYVVGQEFNQSRSEKDPLIACINATTGYQLWNITWDEPAYFNGMGTDVIVDSSGNFYVTGYYGPDHDRVLFLRKYNPSRELLWESTYQDITSWAQGIALDDNSNIFVTGGTEMINYESSALLMKFASNGTLLRLGSWKGNTTAGYNVGYNVEVDTSGNVYMVGKTPGISGNDAFIIKNLELLIPSKEGNGGTGGTIPGFNLWIIIGLLSCAVLVIKKKHLKNQ